MKVLFDHQIFTNQQYGGISRYFYELMLRFDGEKNTARSSVLFSNNEYLNDNETLAAKPFFPGKNFRYKQSIQNAINTIKTNVELKQGDFHVFHPTYYNAYFLKHLKNKPFVVTFLDMIHEKYEHLYPELRVDKKIFANKRMLLERANKVIAISESTKQDIMDLYGVDGRNIDVVYLGSSLRLPEKDSASAFDFPYLLFVGIRASYKNFSLYLEAVAPILQREKLALVCAGGGAFSSAEISQIEKLGLNGLVHFRRIDNDAVLSNLYANALAFVFPSLYEGFGIPVLEAFSTNCPILLSDGGSLKEVAGDAALYFDGIDAESMHNNLLQFLSDAALRQTLIKRGRERLKRFSWDHTYNETIKVYNSIL